MKTEVPKTEPFRIPVSISVHQVTTAKKKTVVVWCQLNLMRCAVIEY